MDVRTVALGALLGLGALVGLVAPFGCSGKSNGVKTIVEDARGQPTGDAAVPSPAPGGKGDVQIKVEWKQAPADVRASPGRTSCGTARPAAVTPTTLWGIPDVVVALDVAATSSRGAQRIVFDRCSLAPRVVVAHGSVVVASAMEQPQKLAIVRAGQLPLGGALKDDKPRDIYLPIAGHEVEVALAPGTIARVVAGTEDAWLVASDNPFVAVTEGNGAVVLRDVPSGTHDVVAWLPARSGQPARVARGKVAVTAGALTEVALDISSP